MSDLIERSEVLKQLRLNQKDVVYIDKKECARRIEAIPSARPKGEWEYHSNPAIGINPEDAFCSYCKYHIDTTMVDFDDYNFCPNCGADMTEREGE